LRDRRGHLPYSYREDEAQQKKARNVVGNCKDTIYKLKRKSNKYYESIRYYIGNNTLRNFYNGQKIYPKL
jgi:hypothetical protein